ncbi:MAG: hypothetical protein E2O39_17365 [Planctomycetota bacterium]|nr:MAG: hypothetical protein E2O39_17365 [Planctomycetota bacterium]
MPTEPDEDLFEFPQPGAGEGSRAGLTVAQEVALAIEGSNEILAHAPRPAPGGTEGLDPDEDIFNFHELFTAAESQAGDEVIAHYSAPEPDGARPAASSGPAAGPTRTVAPAPEAPRSAPARAPVAPPVAALETGGSSGALEHRLVLALALGFILVNAALILTAWQASESFQSTLDYVRTDLSSTLTDLRVQNELHAAAPAITPAPAPAPDPGPQAPTPLGSFSTLELALAQREIEAGAHGAARTRLYRMLANADRLVLEAAELADAEYLIAETYFAQGESLAEGRP